MLFWVHQGHLWEARTASSIPIQAWQKQRFCIILAVELIVLMQYSEWHLLFPFPHHSPAVGCCCCHDKLCTWTWWPLPEWQLELHTHLWPSCRGDDKSDPWSLGGGCCHSCDSSQWENLCCSAAVPQEGAVPRNFSAISMNFESVASFQPWAAAVCVWMQEEEIGN